MRNSKLIRNVEQGDIFGEIALIFPCPRTATIISENYTTLAYMPLRHFYELWEVSPDTFYMIKSQATNYKGDPWFDFKIKLLSQVDYFKKLRFKQGFLSSIQYFMKEHVYQEEQIIMDFDE